ncbi:hypothetical protein D7D52_33590 [Nocardia yunnanensis]|uniref:Uncharacterized protein n=1 Tax=Nocardia yunnanensis TaxID=2382165 RepID=A0A386ZMY6_9NOCA|nr:hypothetical protein [Nocardia yunnanensis]AYF77935.1 hypothetical protein D7D52_33590 [Nocardia yunnanensis]
MDVQVIPGRLIEVPSPDATGMDRRAFGEFIGPRGELASYAFGWTTGADPHAGRFSIGIGAWNPGGATFHAVAFERDGAHAFGLIDDPFENVPQGGPDLTAEQARAHEDLPFIWWVVDNVMDRDPRARWMRHWLMGTRCIQTPEVFEQQEPILYVSHDADDGLWQLIGPTDAGSKGHIGHLHHAIDEDPGLMDVLDLEPGFAATRSAPGGLWTRSAVPE